MSEKDCIGCLYWNDRGVQGHCEHDCIEMQRMITQLQRIRDNIKLIRNAGLDLDAIFCWIEEIEAILDDKEDDA